VLAGTTDPDEPGTLGAIVTVGAVVVGASVVGVGVDGRTLRAPDQT
jgi:hypothetical protein